MNRREHKRDIFDCLLMSIRGDLDSGAGWIFENQAGDYNQADLDRRLSVLLDVCGEFARRAGLEPLDWSDILTRYQEPP